LRGRGTRRGNPSIVAIDPFSAMAGDGRRGREIRDSRRVASMMRQMLYPSSYRTLVGIHDIKYLGAHPHIAMTSRCILSWWTSQFLTTCDLSQCNFCSSLQLMKKAKQKVGAAPDSEWSLPECGSEAETSAKPSLSPHFEQTRSWMNCENDPPGHRATSVDIHGFVESDVMDDRSLAVTLETTEETTDKSILS
ncbi:hypothetical protein KCU88_g453, partial [Aureobasidium melanogenum]